MKPCVIVREAKTQCQAQFGKLPDALVACVSGGSNAIGLFHPFLEDNDVAMYGVEAAGLDYPGVGPEHSWLKDIGRATYVSAADEEALRASRDLIRIEGIMPALESAHVVAYAMKLAATMRTDQTIAINLPGLADGIPQS
jgi:tryptophan synthase beta chain